MFYKLIYKSGMTEDLIAETINGVKNVIAVLDIKQKLDCVTLDGKVVLKY